MIPNADEVLKKLLEDPKYKQEWDENQNSRTIRESQVLEGYLERRVLMNCHN